MRRRLTPALGIGVSMQATKSDFAQASQEIIGGIVDEGLLAMATSKALGDHQKMRAIYIGLRAQEIARARFSHTTKHFISSTKDFVSSTTETAFSLFEYLWSICFYGLIISFILLFLVMMVFAFAFPKVDPVLELKIWALVILVIGIPLAHYWTIRRLRR